MDAESAKHQIHQWLPGNMGPLAVDQQLHVTQNLKPHLVGVTDQCALERKRRQCAPQPRNEPTWMNPTACPSQLGGSDGKH